MRALKIPIIMFLLALKFCFIEGQWNKRSCYSNQGFSVAPTYKLPVKYVPAQPIATQANNLYPGPEPISQNVPYPYPPYPPYPSNNPGDVTIPPSYPGQPVIVINNGGGGGPGESDDGFDIGELLTLMLAVNGGGGLLGGHGHHGHGHHGPPKQEAPKEEPDEPSGMFPPWYYGYPGFYPGMNGFYPGYFPGMDKDAPEALKPNRESANKSGGSINITIVLPNNSSGSTSVQVDTKDKNEEKKKCKVDKDECEENSE